MSKDMMENLLINLLDCGYLDLRVLNGCEYDISDLIEECKEMGYEKPDLNNLAYAMFYIGKNDLQEAIDERIVNLEDAISDGLVDDDQEKKEGIEKQIEELKTLDAREDFESFHNYLDTSIYLSNHAEEKREIYEKYLQKELDQFEENTGFSLLD